MQAFFKSGLHKQFTFYDQGIVIGKEKYWYQEVVELKMISSPSAIFGVGELQCSVASGKKYTLYYDFTDRERIAQVLKWAQERIDEVHGVNKKYLFKIQAHTGTSLEVYEDYIIIDYMEAGALLSNAMKGGSNGGKRIQIVDITSIQFKEPTGVTVGFIQFEYPGSIGNKGGVRSAMFDENSIPISPQNLSLARQILDYIDKRRKELKNINKVSASPISAADEILKYKNLLDMGVITQEEFDSKKKQLLDL